ncbi:MAG: AtpZ/AtpI family protein [Planctomycetes bacterium]|nr:AtpZ/AtpI family protein [Planctomycetota bacterium]
MAENEPSPRDLGRYFALAQVGLEMVAPIVLGLFLEARLGWAPWGVVVGAVLGLVGGLWHMVLLLNRFDTKD